MFTSNTVVQFNTPPPSGTNNVELRRITSTTPVVDFTSGASLSEADLDTAFKQPIHIAEEAVRDSIAGMTLSGAHWNAESRRITNLAPPVVDTDAATPASISSQVSEAEAAQAAAEVAQTGAVAAETTAVLAAGAAYAARDAAIVAQEAAEAAGDGISGVYPVSGMTQHEVLRADGDDTVVADQMGNLVLTSQGNLSGSSHVINIPDNAFDHFVIELRDFQPSDTNATLIAEFSTDNGSLYYNFVGDYTWALNSKGPAQDLGLSSASDTDIKLARSVNGNRPSRYLKIELFCGDGSTLQNHVRVDGVIWYTSGAAWVVGAGELDGVNATYDRVTNVRLSWQDGETFVQGSRDLYTRITW